MTLFAVGLLSAACQPQGGYPYYTVEGSGGEGSGKKGPVVTVHLDLKNAPLTHHGFAGAIDELLSGTFGPGRIYSPAKQVIDQDPDGEFLRRYCPELEGIPKAFLPEPHKMPASLQRQAGCVIGTHYPPPIVNHREAYASARKRMGGIRDRPEMRAAFRRVQEKHGRAAGGRLRGADQQPNKSPVPRF